MIPALDRWSVQLGETAKSIGSEEFYVQLLDLLGAMLVHDKGQLVRYSRFAPPEDIVLKNYPRYMSDYYMKRFFPHCPYYNFWINSRRSGVVTLSSIIDSPSPNLSQNLYRHVFMPLAKVTDEVGMFLPSIGKTAIGLFVSRSTGRYTEAELKRIVQVFPAFVGLHKAHLSRVLGAIGRGAKPPQHFLDRPTLLMDHIGNSVYSNRAWRETEKRYPALKELARQTLRTGQALHLDEDTALHVEQFDADSPLAPGGQIVTLEKRSSSIALPSLREVIEHFGPSLTLRERDVIEMSLKGYPIVSIADRLKIARGTVKNHRNHIYSKLDITTERELFTLYLESLDALLQRAHSDQFISFRSAEPTALRPDARK